MAGVTINFGVLNIMKKFLSLLALLLVASCVTPTEKPVACPEIGILPEAENITFFDNAQSLENTSKNMKVSASFANYKGNCVLKPGRIEFSMEVFFKAERGRAGGALDEFQLPYFMAVLTPQDEILQRDAFQTSILFNERGIGLSSEKHVVVIPVSFIGADGKKIDGEEQRKQVIANTIASRKVVLGFALSPEQLAYNKGEDKEIPADAATPANTKDLKK